MNVRINLLYLCAAVCVAALVLLATGAVAQQWGVTPANTYRADGSTWQQLTTGVPPCSTSYRHKGSALYLNGLFYKVNHYSTLVDTWSSPDAVNWRQITANNGIASREDSSSLVYDNKLWVLGGNGKSDVWSSTDGITWTQVTTSATAVNKRKAFAGVHNGLMWVCGGASSKTVHTSTDGVTWAAKTDLPDIRWMGGRALSYRGKLWVIGGTKTGSDNYNQVWTTVDGTTWNVETFAADLPSIDYHDTFTDGLFMWVVGGRFSRAVRYLSSDGLTWTLASADAGFGGSSYNITHNFTDRIVSLNAYTGAGFDQPQPNVWHSGVTASGYVPNPATVERGVKPAVGVGNFEAKNIVELRGYATSDGAPYQTVYHDGKLWHIGGYTTAHVKKTHTSVDGVTWTDLGDNNLPDANRYKAAVVSLDGKMVAWGGEKNDDVYSSTDGITWTKIADALANAGSFEMQNYAVFLGKLWSWSGRWTNKVLSTTDGVTWTNHGDLFAKRFWSACGALPEFKGKIWSIGGYGASTYLNDVWNTTDGLNWNLVTAAGVIPARFGAQLFADDNNLYVLGGYSGSGLMRDMWYSPDGANWTRASETTRIDNRTWFAGGVPVGDDFYVISYPGNNTPVYKITRSPGGYRQLSTPYKPNTLGGF
jgi:hypothetical protein